MDVYAVLVALKTTRDVYSGCIITRGSTEKNRHTCKAERIAK